MLGFPKLIQALQFTGQMMVCKYIIGKLGGVGMVG
jgi:hypothetical protein